MWTHQQHYQTPASGSEVVQMLEQIVEIVLVEGTSLKMLINSIKL